MQQSKAEKPTFIDQMSALLHEHHLHKLKQEHKGEQCLRQRQAKAALMQLGNASQQSQASEEDIGRWSHYRVPDKNQGRASLNAKPRRFALDERQFFRYLPERTGLQYHCRSERAIPKLKIILHQLEQPLVLPPQSKPADSKPKQNRQALAISNKQELRPTRPDCKSACNEGENKRPQLDNLTTRTSACSYQKIRRGGAQRELQYERELLSQLIRGKCGAGQGLGGMLEYATVGKGRVRLGLDRLLS